MMSGKECLYAGVFEGEFYDGPSRFFGEAAPPIGIAQMNSEFEDLVCEAIGAEAGATDVLLGFEQENRPILDIVSGAEINFSIQPFLNFFRRKRAADEACGVRVSPECYGKRQVRARPLTKTETRRLQEILVHAESNLCGKYSGTGKCRLTALREMR
jgi:hypothetical protein